MHNRDENVIIKSRIYSGDRSLAQKKQAFPPIWEVRPSNMTRSQSAPTAQTAAQ